MNLTPVGIGWIEVITGCMFSGKTEELIRRLRRAEYAKQKVVVFKPNIDNRYSETHVVSHGKQAIPSVVISEPAEALEHIDGVDVVGVDEAQFFGIELVDVCEQMANDGRRVVVAGLDQDFRGLPFEPIPQLLAVAEFITKVLAICMVCGNPADRSQRIVNRETRFLVGATDMYEARCRKCFLAEKPGAIQELLPLPRVVAHEVQDVKGQE